MNSTSMNSNKESGYKVDTTCEQDSSDDATGRVDFIK